LMELADDLAYGLTALRMREEVRRRAAHQEALGAIIAAASVASNLSELLEVILAHVLQALDLEMGAIWIEGKRILRGLPLEPLLVHSRAARDAGLDVPAPIAVEDWEREERGGGRLAFLAPSLLRCGVRSSITVPLFAEGRRLGGLSVAAREVRAWPVEEVALLEAVGRQLGAVVNRLSLGDKTREQARLILRILEAVPEGMVLLDTSGRVLLANPAGREILAALAGVQEGELLTHLGGRPLAEVLSPLPPGRWHEVGLEGPPQRIFDVLAQGLGEDAPGGWVLVVREVTADREMRARAEQQDRLAVMGQIAAGIAHDFANILQGVLSFAELLEERQDLPEEAREPLRFIRQMAERGAQMTRQILDFGRKSAAEKRLLEPEAFLREVAALLRRTIPESIRVVLESEPGVPCIWADAACLQQILLNLATNARDAMPEGGQLTLRLASLTVGPGGHPLYPDLPVGRWVCLEVTDTGCGIPAEVLPHIFEPFFTTKERGYGTGLGLSQVYGLVKQHDGFIDVRTEVGKGTCFTLLFPALSGEETVDAQERRMTSAGGGKTVLLVEDEPGVQTALREMLSEMGYRVLVAPHGPEALELYKWHRDEIAVVLTDAVMPWMDSATLLRTLREQDARVKVVVVSGYPSGEGPYPQEVDAWLSKPVSRAQLAETLGRLIGDK
ncbi:MAG: ATP-binding protein, partial [Chloroflexia bacterium]